MVGFGGLVEVMVGVNVLVGVLVRVGVLVCVLVFVGVGVSVNVGVGEGVIVRVNSTNSGVFVYGVGLAVAVSSWSSPSAELLLPWLVSGVHVAGKCRYVAV